MAKDFYGFMSLNTLWLNASSTPPGSSAYPNPFRFLSQDGSTCLTGQGAGGVSPTCTANSLSALKLSFPGATGTFETDLEYYLRIGRLAVQYGATGYLPASDNNKSILGLQMTDKVAANKAARFDIDGAIRVFGF